MAKGFKSGGRQRGTPNKRTQEDREKAAAGGQMPLEFLLEVMRNPKSDMHDRMDAAKTAAQYLHAKVASDDAGMRVSINGEYTNGHDKSAETNGIVVQFVAPRKHVENE